MTVIVWYPSILNIVASHKIRNPQAPISDTAIGRIDYPIPRSTPTMTSIIPHRA